MLQDQFIFRLLLIVFFGILYIYAMKLMAGYKSVEITPQRHIVLKVIGAIFIFSAICSLCLGIYVLTQISYPERTIDFSYGDMIVRSSETEIIWGYPTSEQNQALKSITNVFSSVALGAYCFYFRKTDRKWWKKTLRFFYGVLMFASYCSSTNLHYFDTPELIAPILFCIMAFDVLVKGDIPVLYKSVKVQPVQVKEDSNIKEKEKTDETRYMPQNAIVYTRISNSDAVNNSKQSYSESTKENDSAEETSDENKVGSVAYISCDDKSNMIKYCRHCGKPVDYNSGTYCKYCGKILS